MNELSYSLHLSSKKNAVSTAQTLGKVSKHNLRDYENLKEGYDRNKISILIGTGSILDDVKDIYHQEFDDALAEYNATQKSYRQIDDYFQHVSDSRSDVAAELIIQIGTRDFWSSHEVDQMKMNEVMKAQLRSLQEQMPGFKIASAVVHYDETSPHMHVIGVPVAEGYTNGLYKQVAKTKVFTKQSLKELQEVMHISIQKQLNELYPELEVEIKQSAKGRNQDFLKTEYIELCNVRAAVESQTDRFKMLDSEITEKTANALSTDAKVRAKNKTIKQLKKQIEELNKEIEIKKNEIYANLEYIDEKVREELGKSYENIDRCVYDGLERGLELPEGSIVRSIQKSLEETQNLYTNLRRFGREDMIDYSSDIIEAVSQNIAKVKEKKKQLFQNYDYEIYDDFEL